MSSFLVAQIADLIGAAPSDVDPARALSELGIDSTDLLTLLFDAEERFATTLTPGMFVEVRTIDGLAERIAAALAVS